MAVIPFCKRAGAPALSVLICAGLGCGPYGGPEIDPDAGVASASASAADGAGGAGGEGGGDCGAGGQGGQGGAVDVNDPCASLTAPGAPPARVVWVTEPEPVYTLTSPISLQWAFQVAVRVPLAEQAAYTLEYEVCETPAHQATTCSTTTLPLPADECAVLYGPRFGLDSSQYRRGTNAYSLTLRLRHGCAVESEDALQWTVVYRPQGAH